MKKLLVPLLLLSGSAMASNGVVYKSPSCGCCKEWINHMTDAGFELEAIDHGNLTAIKKQHGVSPQLASCHTAVIDGYVVEGHVPAQDVKRLLAEKPTLTGISVPGMPLGSPGMEYNGQTQAYKVIGFTQSGMTVEFNRYQ